MKNKTRVKKGFTLIELLVVIAIIAVLLAVILPALRLAKSQAIRTVCLANLGQVGKALELYTFEHDYKRLALRNNDSVNPGEWDYYWMKKLAPYSENDSFAQESGEFQTMKMIHCPAAPMSKFIPADPDLVNPAGQYGSAAAPWHWNRSAYMSTTGALMFNAWVGYDAYYENNPNYSPYLYKTWLDITANTPIFGDGAWTVAWPRGTDASPVANPAGYNNLQGRYSPGFDTQHMQRFCLDRHNKRINLIYKDLHADTIGNLQNLWTLRWHKDYVPPTDLPDMPEQ